jgi:hypothetical protein
MKSAVLLRSHFSCHCVHLGIDYNSKMTRSRGRSSTYNKRPANLDRHTCDMALNIVARKVEVAKANNGGVVKYKAITDIVESMSQPFLG